VHETWSCEEEDYDHHGFRSGRGYEEDEDREYEEDAEPDGRLPGTPELTELIDSDIELPHWIGLCATLTRYLRASDRVRFECPLAKTQRAHIHGIVDSRDLPVRHTTRRTGRPFTLLLEKTAGVFERDATDCRSWQNDLQWLKGTTADF
jgi:hypothetical protein